MIACITVDGAVDAHVHLWTNQRELYLRVAGAQEYAPQQFTPKDFLAHAQPYGVDNSYMLDCIRAHPGVFSGIAIINSAAPDPDSAMKALSREGIRGFRIAPGESSQGWL